MNLIYPKKFLKRQLSKKTKERYVIKFILKNNIKSRTVLRKLWRGGYRCIIKNNRLMNQYLPFQFPKHYKKETAPKRRNTYTRKYVKKFLSKKKLTRKQLYINYSGIYDVCLYKFPDLLPKRTTERWTYKKVKKVAKRFKYKSDFTKNFPGAYQWARNNNKIKYICRHMKPKGNIMTRYIYAFIFKDRYVYVGLTWNLRKRKYQHLNVDKGPVYKHIKICSNYRFKVLERKLKPEVALNREQYYINYYKNKKYNMLNSLKSTRRSLGPRR